MDTLSLGKFSPVLAMDVKTLTPTTQIRRQEMEMKIVWQLSVIFELIFS